MMEQRRRCLKLVALSGLVTALSSFGCANAQNMIVNEGQGNRSMLRYVDGHTSMESGMPMRRETQEGQRNNADPTTIQFKSSFFKQKEQAGAGYQFSEQERANDGQHPAQVKPATQPFWPQADDGFLNVFTTMCGDKKYVKYAKAMVRSLRFSSRPVHLHIMHDNSPNIVDLMLNPLMEMQDMDFFDSDHFRISHSITTVPERLKHRFRLCTCSRLMMAEEFPHLTLTAYIDADAVIKKDIAEFFALADSWTSRQWMGMAVEGTRTYLQEQYSDIKVGENGVNAGILLADISKWRQTDFTEFAMSYDGHMALADQDILNAFFSQEERRDEISIFPCAWNYRNMGQCRETPLKEVGIMHGSCGTYDRIETKRPQRQWELAVWLEDVGVAGASAVPLTPQH